MSKKNNKKNLKKVQAKIGTTPVILLQVAEGVITPVLF